MPRLGVLASGSTCCICSSASTPRETTSGTPRRGEPAVREIYALPRLHEFFARTACGRPMSSRIRSPPIHDRPRCCARCWRGGDCEIGAHHHAWETPPCTADDVRRHPYASTLPRRQFDAQLESLTDAIAARSDSVPCRIVPDASGSRPITWPRSSGAAIWWSRASRRCSTNRTRAGRSSSRRR